MSGRGANVVDLVPISVRIFRENLDLRSVCSCGRADREERCEHVVCALVALLHLLRPNLFRMTRENPAYRAQLEAGLLKEPSQASVDTGISRLWERLEASGGRVAPSFKVIMDDAGGRLRAHVEMNGTRLDENLDFRGLPWEVAYLARSGYQHDMSYALSVFLKRTDKLYPLFYEEGGQRHEIEWLGERVCPTWTELDARGGQIVVRKACSLRDDGEPAWTVIGNFALNAARSAMAQITPRNGWQCWDMLRARCTDDAVVAGRVKLSSGSEIRIPVDVYRSFQIALKKSREKEVRSACLCRRSKPIQACHHEE
jgi:hypothetical protein